MNKSQETKDARAKYIQETVNNSDKRTTEIVIELADELFLSEQTIYRDLAKD